MARPKGSKSVFPAGSGKLIAASNQAERAKAQIELLAETLPEGSAARIEAYREAERLGVVVEEAQATILGVMRGDISGRHLRERLGAAIWLVEQAVGRAKQKIEVTTRRDGVYRAEFDDGTPVHPSADAELPN